MLFSYDDTATGLMGGEDEYLGNLDVGWGIGCIDGYIGDVVTRQWLDALIEFCGTIGIALEADITEVRLYKAWLEVGDAYGGVGHIDTETVGEGFHGSLCGSIYIASCIGGIASHGTDVNDMSAIACNHFWYNQARHGEQAFDVGVDHGLPIV